MVTSICDSLQRNSFIVYLNGTAATAALTEMLHYFSMFILVGATAIVDLRVLGVTGKGQTATELAQRLFRWGWWGFTLNALTGFLMFACNATAYISDPTFHLKVGVVLAAAVFGLTVQWMVPRWDLQPYMPVTAKAVALISLLLWLGAILAGTEVPARSGIG